MNDNWDSVSSDIPVDSKTDDWDAVSTPDLAAAMERRRRRQPGQSIEEEPQVIAAPIPDSDILGTGELLEQLAAAPDIAVSQRAFQQAQPEEEIIEAPRREPEARAARAPVKRGGIKGSSVAIVLLSLAVIGLSVFTGLNLYGSKSGLFQNAVNHNDNVRASATTAAQAQVTSIANAGSTATARAFNTVTAQTAATVTAQAAASAALPTIVSVSQFRPVPNQQIIISGQGFGTHAPFTNSTTNYMSINDVTVSNWQSGYGYDWVTISVSVWTDNQIVITGFSGYYGRDGFVFNAGDTVDISVWNAQSGKGGTGTAEFSIVVVS